MREFLSDEDITFVSPSFSSSGILKTEDITVPSYLERTSEISDYYQVEISVDDIEELDDKVRNLIGEHDALVWREPSVPGTTWAADAASKIDYPGPFVIADTTVFGGRKHYILDPTSSWMRDELELAGCRMGYAKLLFRAIKEDETVVFMEDPLSSGPSKRISVVWNDSMVEALNEVDLMQEIEERLEEL